jgi:hypothetical protein
MAEVLALLVLVAVSAITAEAVAKLRVEANIIEVILFLFIISSPL